MITITDPNDERNATAIRLGADKKPKSSYIEEVYEDDLEKDF